MKRLWLSTMIILFISGCATQTVKLRDAKPVPDDRVYYQSQTGGNTGDVTIVRDSGMMGSGCHAQIFLDGELASDMRVSETVTFRVSEGDHIIGTTTKGGGLCSFSVDLQERDLKIKAGEKRYYRVFMDASGTPSIMPTTQAH